MTKILLVSVDFFFYAISIVPSSFPFTIDSLHAFLSLNFLFFMFFPLKIGQYILLYCDESNI